MKIKYIAFTLISIFIAVAAKCQHQIYFETFNGAANSFTINDTGIGSNKGNNKWIVDTNYFGGLTYPNTTNENYTYGGGITAAPYSKYLHIYDSASGYTNDNYNPADSCTRFAHMTSGICTKSLTNINFNFYYVCQGSPTAYGLVYYSIDGGPWKLTGDTLNKRYKWQYATVTSPSFTNVEDLRFGFLWHNNKAVAGRDTSGLGVDDISIYGVYDSINHPITCTITNFFSDSCFAGTGYVYFGTQISDSTCTATWDAFMSNGNGSFPGPYAWYQVVADSLFNDINQYWYLQPPASFATPGHCYKFKVQRMSYPYLTFYDSVCFPFDSCPGTITTLQPPATLTDTVCAGSVIDVGFYSSGLYNVYNIYYTELIDSIGNTAKIDTIGHLISNVAYVYPPGDIVSTIPDTVPAGCNYYVRVVSSTPNRTPIMWGPFCIQHCDILTNNQQGFQVCLQPCSQEPQGYTDTISFKVHEYDSLAHYNAANKFEVQLIYFNVPFEEYFIINTGLLGIKIDTTTGKMLLHVPCPDTLNMYGITPGVYYARIIADSSSFPDSALGTLIHITIGEPADNMYLTVSPSSGPFCAGESTVVITANPNNSGQGSTYSWWQTDKKSGKVPINVSTDPYAFNPQGADTVIITCQENSFGCLGNIATLPDTIIFIARPNITKTGPLSVCLGDTGTYSIPFEGATSYIWTLPAGAHADTSTNELKINFTATGTFRISVLATNSCFTDSAVWLVSVVNKPNPTITSVPNSNVFCAGTSVMLTASAAGATSYTWDNGKKTSSITVIPTSDTAYWVTVANKACSVTDTVPLKVIKTDINVNYCVGDTVIMNASGAKSYTWSPSAGLLINDSIAKAVISSIQTYTVIGTTSGCADTVEVSVDPANKSATVSGAVAILSGQSVQLSVQGGSSWYWSPSAGLNNDSIQDPVASPSATTIYTVLIKSPSGCVITDTVTVDVKVNCGIFVPNIFSPSDPGNHNTILYARSECLVSVDFEIFDRWGNKVFESNNLNDGWDGTYKGEALNPGTFVYYVTGKTGDGKTLTQKGNVTLVR